jgi:hypothetical protein
MALWRGDGGVICSANVLAPVTTLSRRGVSSPPTLTMAEAWHGRPLGTMR